MTVATNNYYFSSAIDFMDGMQSKLDDNLPNSFFQAEIDRIVDNMKQEFAPYFEGLYKWLEQNGEANWVEHLKLSLVQLPVRSALNIVTSLYNLISAVFYTAVHPLKGATHLVKSAIILMNELTKPEVWSKIGTGSVGMILGQGLVLSGPFSLMGLALAGALSVGGISVEAFIAALRSERGKEIEGIKEKLGAYLQQLPEVALTGFFSGLLIGGVRRACQSPPDLKRYELKRMSCVTEQPSTKFGIAGKQESITNVAEQAATKVESVAKQAFQSIDNVMVTDWENLDLCFYSLWHDKPVTYTFEDLAWWASNKPNVTHFFICNEELEIPITNSHIGPKVHFFPGDGAIFTGTPKWVPAPSPGATTGYIKI